MRWLAIQNVLRRHQQISDWRHAPTCPYTPSGWDGSIRSTVGQSRARVHPPLSLLLSPWPVDAPRTQCERTWVDKQLAVRTVDGAAGALGSMKTENRDHVYATERRSTGGASESHADDPAVMYSASCVCVCVFFFFRWLVGMASTCSATSSMRCTTRSNRNGGHSSVTVTQRFDWSKLPQYVPIVSRNQAKVPIQACGWHAIMMVDGLVEWTEAEGSRLDVLQQAYNVRLQIVALPKGSTVLLTRFDDGDGGESRLVGDGIPTQKIDELLLHSDDVAGRSYIHVAWSTHSDQTQWLAIASTTHVEVWEVSIADSAIRASLKGSAMMDRIRTLCWNPRLPLVMMNSDTKNVLINVTQERIAEIELSLTSKPVSHIVKRCAWSPCGLTLARAFKKDIEFYSWSKLEDILHERPIRSDFRVDRGVEGHFLDAPPSHIGPIVSISQLSASVCLLTTELALSLDEPARMGLPAPRKSSIELPKVDAIDTSSNVIDLTSMRITTSSRSSILNILDNPPDPSPVVTKVQTPPQSARVILVVKDTNGQWRQASNIEIPKLTLPDRLRVEGMRVVIGSSLSNVLLAAHLDHDTRSIWSLAISGELELSNGYTCRGIHLAQTSPFVQVATTEKAKRTFFSTTPGIQRIQLCKLKLPQRPTKERYPPVNPPTAIPTASQQTANHIGMEDVVNGLAALQTRMISRFDRIDEQLASMCRRLEHLEATKTSK